MCESTAMFSPRSPSAVIAFARNVIPEKVGLADTDIRIGVVPPLLIATLVIAGFEMPRVAGPWPWSLIVQFEMPMLLLNIVRAPSEPLVVANLRRAYWTDPVAPWWK